VLIAECLFSKTVHFTTFPLWSESPTLPFVRFIAKQKWVEERVLIAAVKRTKIAFFAPAARRAAEGERAQEAGGRLVRRVRDLGGERMSGFVLVGGTPKPHMA
jgi:hypothetical protein